MLQVKHLTAFHEGDLRTLLEDVSFTLGPGDRAAVVGEEGNGKSTLLKLIYDPALTEDWLTWTGEIITGGWRLGYLPQELDREEKARSVYEFCAGREGFFDASPKELATLAADLGLPAGVFYDGRPMGALSGGESVKLQLAGLLLSRPDALLLDEPSNGLDLEALAWMEEFLSGCPLPVLFVSHDETLIERTANLVIHLEQVRRKTQPRCTVVRTDYRAYVERRRRALDHQEQTARKEREEDRRRMERYRQIRDKVDHQLNSISRQDPHGGRLLKKKMKAVKSTGRRFEREREEMTGLPDEEEAIFLEFGPGCALPRGKTVLDLDLPSLTAPDGTVLARGLRLHVKGGEKVCITGHNGAGKSTLLRALAQRLLSRTDLKAGYLPQDYWELLDGEATPVEFLAGQGGREEITRARNFLGCVNYTADEMEHSLRALSGGQKGKLLFLKLILDGCSVLLLDEPTQNFSPLSNPVLREVLGRYPGTILAVSHDRKFIREVCDRRYELTGEGLRPVEVNFGLDNGADYDKISR